MARIYSVRFFAVHDQPAIAPLTYTVPAGRLAVVRDIDVYCGDPLGGEEFFARGSVSEVFWQASLGLGETGWRNWRGRQVIYEGESWDIFGTKIFDVAASGYLLTMP